MNKVVEIRMSELAIASSGVNIRTGSIGSCVVIILYDKKNKIGGMAHAMLPTRKKILADKDILKLEEKEKMAAKYADEAIELMLKKIKEKGGEQDNIVAKLVGGARMFKILSGDKFGIGYKNIQSAKNKLQELNIPIKNEETGGSVGRLADFNLSNGLVEVSTKM